jgi:hypothetical protein
MSSLSLSESAYNSLLALVCYTPDNAYQELPAYLVVVNFYPFQALVGARLHLWTWQALQTGLLFKYWSLRLRPYILWSG